MRSRSQRKAKLPNTGDNGECAGMRCQVTGEALLRVSFLVQEYRTPHPTPTPASHEVSGDSRALGSDSLWTGSPRETCSPSLSGHTKLATGDSIFFLVHVTLSHQAGSAWSCTGRRGQH